MCMIKAVEYDTVITWKYEKEKFKQSKLKFFTYAIFSN